MKTTVYVHASEDNMWDHGEALGLTGEALSLFRHACCEVALELEVDPETGEATIISVDGRALDIALIS